MYGMNRPPPLLQPGQPESSGDTGGGEDGSAGTPLRLLQIPPHALAELREALQTPGPSEARFTQDGCSAAGLRGVTELDGESGAVCKQCHLVFATEAQLQRHPCWQRGGARLLLTQRQYQCTVCGQRAATRAEALAHLNRQHGGDAVEKLAALAPHGKTLAALGGTDTNGNFQPSAGTVRGEH